MFQHWRSATEGRNPQWYQDDTKALWGQTLRKSSRKVNSCPSCKGKLIKYGFLKKEKTQRYKCTQCRKACSDARNRVYGTLRSKHTTVDLVVKLLIEGNSVRGASRIANCHRDTVLRILKHAGIRAHEVLTRRLVDLPVKHVQADEIWTFCHKKSKPDTDPETDNNTWGDFYIFLGLESETKLLLLPTIGKRTQMNTAIFARDMRDSTTGRFQLTADGFRPYRSSVRHAFGNDIDFAQYYKEYNMLTADRNGKPKKLKKDVEMYAIRSGTPDTSRITTSHVERVNLTLRTHNKRFNRKTICFSKGVDYLHCSVWLFVYAYNFHTPHSSLNGATPAMQSGLAESRWSVKDLLSAI